VGDKGGTARRWAAAEAPHRGEMKLKTEVFSEATAGVKAETAPIVGSSSSGADPGDKAGGFSTPVIGLLVTLTCVAD
jgi:hypothetical protein